MTEPKALQLILGPNKRNPCFCLYTDAAEKEIHVYYGLELLEVVPKDSHSPAYRLLGSRLYNAGLRVRTLETVFGLDRKTLRRWGMALRSGDRKWLIEVLKGRWGRRKLTLEMEGYVRFRWPTLRAEGRRDYRKQLQEELERVFGVRVSGETLRPLLSQLRKGGGARAASAGVKPAGAESATTVEPRAATMVQGQLEKNEAESGLSAPEAVALTPMLPGMGTMVKSGSIRAQSVVDVADWPILGEPAAAAPSVGGESGAAPGVCPPEGALVLPISSKILPSTQDWSASAPAPALIAGAKADPMAATSPLASRPCAPAPGEPTAAAPSVGGESGAAPGGCPPEGALVLPISSKILPPIQDWSASAPAPALIAGAKADPMAATSPLASRPCVPIPGEPVAVAPSAGGGSVAVPEGGFSEGLVLPALGKVFPAAQDWPAGQTVWCEHAGLLLFGESLAAVSQVVEPAQPWLRQALGSVLAGALNVEQTKYLNPDDLELLLGPQLRGLGPQRRRLKELAEGPTANRLLRWNSQQVGADEQRDFYLDPHTKQYTGMAEVLKGWCPTIHWADKALHSDFLHTASGQPIYFECTDNYEDLRVRLWELLDRGRAALAWPQDKVITIIIDRAVFGKETFDRVLAEPAMHLVTWEKGYQPGNWKESQVSGQCVIQRVRNHSADRESYQFRYIDQKWAVDPRWRQLIVRATHPSGRKGEVSILTEDHTRAAAELVRLMFGRWVQENDFKYSDLHFGFKQITSYGVIGYAQLKPQLTDRQIQSGAARALAEQARQVRAQLGRVLWAQRQAEHRQGVRQARQAELEKAHAAVPESAEQSGTSAAADPAAAVRRRELGRLKAAQTRHETRRVDRSEKLKGLEEQLNQILVQQGQTGQTMSRLEDLIARQMVRLDTGPKRLLDAVKVVARNVFYRALAPFKAAYDNYRDDHEHFRRLTQSAGVLRWNGRKLEVHLLPATPYGAALRRVWEQVLNGVNETQPVWPDGSGRQLVFRLAARSELQVCLRRI